MELMQAATEFKQTDVGLIPEDWQTPSLDSLTVLMTNGFVGTATSHYAEHGKGVLYIQGYNIEANAFNFHGIKYVTKEFHRAHLKSCLRAGDLLTVQTGDVGLTTIVPDSLAGSNCHALIISRFVEEKVCPRFVSYYLNSPQGRGRLKSIEIGTTMKHLNVGDVLEFTIPLPPTLAEQEAIAEALSDADALIESLEQLIAKKRQIKQGAMQELLTGKRRLPGFTGEWDVCEIGDVFNISGGVSASRDELSHEGILYLHYGDIHGATSTLIDVERDKQTIPKLDIRINTVSPHSLLCDGDVVFVDASEDVDGTNKHVVIANPNSIPFISGLHTIVAKRKADQMVSTYCRYCFETKRVKQQFRFFAVGTKVSGVSKTNIRKIEIAVPSSSEQSAIAEILIGMDTEIEALEAKASKYRQIKQGMMHNLLTGKIRLV